MISKTNRIFFHYTTVDGLYGIIDDEFLHATHISYLNDSSEEEYFHKVLTKLLSKNEIASNTYEKLYNSTYENIFDNYEKYIVSFCELSDSLPMWNYYSKGNGYNLGLNIDKIIDRTRTINSIFSHKIKIIYNEHKQLNLLSEFFKKHKKATEIYNSLSSKMKESQKLYNESDYQLYSYEQSELIVKFMDELSVIKKTFKHPSYSNEKEVRLIVEPNQEYDRIFYRKTSSGVIIPYIKIPISMKDDLFSITIHPLQNNTALNGLEHFLRSKKIDLKKNILISQIPFRNI